MIDQDLPELAERIRTLKVRPTELVERSLARIRSQGRLKAFVRVFEKEAREAAAEAEVEIEAGRWRGPLHGIPCGIKDNISTREAPSSAGCAALEGRLQARDADVVACLRRAGAIVVGKTSLNELAYGVTGQNQVYGDTLNPRDPAHLSGGSSGGSAAAVAAGLVGFSLGTDTGGSVRIPAALCGVCGFKPSQGVLDLGGVLPLAPTMDHLGFLCRDPGEAGMIWRALQPAGEGRTDSSRPDPGRLRVGLVDFDSPQSFEEPVLERYRHLAQKVESLGWDWEPVSPAWMEPARACAETVLHYEAARTIESLVGEEIRLLQEPARAMYSMAARISGKDYADALDERESLERQVEEFFHNFDLLISPTVAIQAPLRGLSEALFKGRSVPVGIALTHYVMVNNLFGLPSLTIPLRPQTPGPPVGFHVWAKRQKDDLVLWAGDKLREIVILQENNVI